MMLIKAFSNAVTVHAEVADPADAVTVSAIGLDPHINLSSALAQVAPVAKARGVYDSAHGFWFVRSHGHARMLCARTA